MRTIGKYEVVEKIGEGGFGTIFKGFDPHIRRFVAIKSCTSDEEDLRSRFLHEAQIAGNLQHRHVVTVYDFGLQDGVPYLVQEYLSGEDLDRKIKRQEFIPLAEKLLYLIQVARGLEYAHSRGVVHRDVKPANIRILEDGTAKIMDFGIAKLADQETGLTATGMTIGTAAYLAPEQIRGEPIDRRTDIFSWGVTAWELLAYRRPFTGQHISTVLYQILHVPAPRLRPAVTDCPAELEHPGPVAAVQAQATVVNHKHDEALLLDRVVRGDIARMGATPGRSLGRGAGDLRYDLKGDKSIIIKYGEVFSSESADRLAGSSARAASSRAR